jgi:signal transduction histidine kinase
MHEDGISKEAKMQNKLSELEKIQKQLKDEFEKNMDYSSTVIDSITSVNKTIKIQRFSIIGIENLVNDMMDLAKLENNQFQLDNEYFNLPNLIHSVLSVLQPVAE